MITLCADQTQRLCGKAWIAATLLRSMEHHHQQQALHVARRSRPAKQAFGTAAIEKQMSLETGG
jgi:hypothetical protein